MHLIKMSPGHLFLEMSQHVLLGQAPELTGGDYASHPAWDCLEIPQEKQEGTPGDWVIYNNEPNLLSPRPDPR